MLCLTFLLPPFLLIGCGNPTRGASATVEVENLKRRDLTIIRTDFTELEKQNIKLLLSYEKNAAEYYDSFGRG